MNIDLRKSIHKHALDSKLLDLIGRAEMDTELQKTVDKIIQDKDLVKKEAEAKLGLDEEELKKASRFCHKGSKKNGGLVHQLGRLTIDRKLLVFCSLAIGNARFYYLSRTYLFLNKMYFLGLCSNNQLINDYEYFNGKVRSIVLNMKQHTSILDRSVS